MIAEDQLARRLEWLRRVAAAEVPGLRVGASESDDLMLVFGSAAWAERFQQALVAESMPARINGNCVELPVRVWYSPGDLQALALAVAKVAHYLGAA